MVVTPMAMESKEAVWSMGDDTPIAPLARSSAAALRVLPPAFCPGHESAHRFAARVLRRCRCARASAHGRILLDKRAPVPGLALPSPFLTLGQMAALHEGTYALMTSSRSRTSTARLRKTPRSSRPYSICRIAQSHSSSGGVRILLMTDRTACDSLLPIPMAMATGAVHHALVKAGLRTLVGLVLEAGDCRDVHHAAVLIGYGAGSVCPWLALQTARALAGEDGEARLLKVLDTGLAKIMSKMGIIRRSTAIALRNCSMSSASTREITDLCFPGTASPMGGQNFADIEAALRSSWSAEPEPPELPDYGWVRFRRAEGAEPHTWQPQRTRDLQSAVGAARANTQAATTLAPARSVVGIRPRTADEGEPAALRDLLAIHPGRPRARARQRSSSRRAWCSDSSPAPCRSAHSQPEAHQTITIAMNLLGARSNTGEGGEDPAAYQPTATARGSLAAQQQDQAGGVRTLRRDRRRISLTPTNCEIKIAQGSKPGEGGQLPGHKVTRTDRAPASRAARRHADLAAAASRHLQHRRSRAADLRPEAHQPARAQSGEAGLAGRASARSPRVSPRLTPTTSSIAGHSGGTGASPLSQHQACGQSVGARPRRSATGSACTMACAVACVCAPMAALPPRATC